MKASFALSGGDIKISADKLSGNGSLTARSAIGATIKNSSPLPLRINDVDMENAGGYVSLNGNVLKKDGYNFKTLDMDGNFENPPVLEINHSGKKYGSLSPDIYVDGDINDSTGKVTLTDEQGSVIVRGNILASGGVDIVTPNGGFMLNNTKENFNLIDPMAKYTLGNEDVANALQKYIALNGNSKIFSSYDEYLNTIFSQITDAVKTATGGSTNRDTWKANIKKRYDTDDSSAEPATSIVANGPINITAKYINVNGLIQSGFTNYTGAVDSAKVSKLTSDSQTSLEQFKSMLTNVLSNSALKSNDKTLLTQMSNVNSYEELQNLLKSNGINDLSKYFDNLISSYNKERSKLGTLSFITNPANSVKFIALTSSLEVINSQVKKISATSTAATLKDSEVVGNEKYLVTSNTVNNVWNSSTKMYDGAVNVYYNPVTKNLLTDDINVNGGYVRLKGTIVSTGGGRIISAKGGADISIDTQAVNNDIHLGAINNNNRQGIVIIDDSSKGTQTFTSNSTYTPDNYAFGWTGGVNYRQTSKYNYTESGNIFEIFGRTIWGLVSSGFKGAEAERYVQEYLDKRMNSSNVSKSTYGTPTSLKNLTRGAFIQKINDGNTWNNIKNNNLYTTTSRSNVFNVKDYNYKDDWTIDTSWAFWETQIRMWRDWYSDEDYSATSTYYIPANKTINIETPTASQGGKISITANGNVYVDRNINNPTSGSSTEIKSVKGSVETKNNSVIRSDNIKLEADKVMTADVKGTNGNVNLNARSNYGNISIKTPDSLTTDGIRTYDGQSVTINAGGAIINNVGTGTLYFDKISAPYGFGLKTPSVVAFSDSSFKNRSEEIFNVYKQGWQTPKFKYTVNELNDLLKKFS